jgi:hypothetical protein
MPRLELLNVIIIKILGEDYETVVFYGRETWSFTLRAEHKLRAPKNKVSRTLGPKGAEILRGWRKLRKEELHNLYSSPRMIKSKRSSQTGHVARMATAQTYL